MVEGSRNTPDAGSNPVRGISIFLFYFLFHLGFPGFPLIQLKVTKSYEIAGRGSPES